MNRPLMRQNIAQLEALFETLRGDPGTLRQLEHELQNRHVPRAVTLLAEVQAAMSSTAPVSPAEVVPVPPPPVKSPAPPVRQPELWERAPLPPVVSPPVVTQPRPPAPEAKPLVPRAAVPKPTPPEPPTMPVDDAYKLLKATPSSTWESIEQTRRELVQQASPARVSAMNAEKRAQLQAEAKRVNTAYAVLSRQRIGG